MHLDSNLAMTKASPSYEVLFSNRLGRTFSFLDDRPNGDE